MNIIDDEGFIHPSKSSKNLISNSRYTHNIEIENKYETHSDISDDSADMDNEII